MEFWKYNEGLCTYLEAFLDNIINFLETREKRTKYPYEKQYYLYAIKFRKLLKNKKTPEKCRLTLLKFYKNLK